MSRAGKIAKWGLIGIAGLLAVAAITLGLGYGWLSSADGRSWLTRQIEAAVSTESEIELSIGSLTGDLLHSLKADNIVLRDGDGVWFTLAALEVDWLPWQLMSGTLDIERVKLTRVEVPRLPASGAGEDVDSDTTPGDLLDFPLKVRIGQLAADEVGLGAPVLGQAARFTLSGKATRQEDGSLNTTLDLRRIDDIEGRLSARLHYEPQGDSLAADLEAISASGGLLAALLDTPELPGARVKLVGEGPLTDWAGDFSLYLGDVAEARADIGLRRESNGDLAFSLKGGGDVQPPDGEIWQLLAGRTEVDLAGAWQDQRRVRLDRFAASNESRRLSLSGDIETDTGRLDLTLTATADDATALARLAELDQLRRISAEIALTGTLNRPEARLDLRAEGLATPDVRAETLSARGKVQAASDLLGASPLLSLDLEGEAGLLRLPDQAEVNQVLGDRLPWRLDGRFHLNNALLEVAALEADAGPGTVIASGSVDLNTGSGTLQTQLEVPDLAALQPLTEVGLSGPIKLAGPLRIERFGSRLDADLAGRWEQPGSEIGLIDKVAGGGLDVEAQFTVDGRVVRIEAVHATSPATQITASLTVDGPQLRDGRYKVVLADAKALAGELGVAVSGKASAEGTISGPFDALAINGRGQLTQVTVAEQSLSEIAADYKLRLKGSDVDGPVQVALTSPFGRAEARTDLRVRRDAVTLAKLSAHLPQTTVDGEVRVPLDGAAPVADLKGEVGDLSPWLAFAGFSGSGSGNLTVQLNKPGAAAPLTASADFSAVVFRPEDGAVPLHAARLRVNATAQDPAFEKPGKVTIAAEELTRNDLKLERLDLTAAGTVAGLDVDLATKGKWIEPIDLTAKARIEHQGETTSVALRSAKGKAFGQPLQLKQTATLTLAPNVTRLENLAIASGDTNLTADARMGDGEVSVQAKLDALPMSTVDAVWQSGMEGEVSAQISLSGSFDNPQGDADITASGLRPRDAKDLPKLNLTSTASWRNGRLQVNGELGGAQVTSAQFSADAPLQLSPEGAVVVPQDAPLSGRVKWDGNIRTLALFVPLPGHRFDGPVAVDVSLSGTPGTPAAEGRIVLENGRYENLEQGTVIANLALTAEITEQRLTLASLSGGDGNGGKIRGQGHLDIDPAADFPFDVSIRLDKFRALRRDEVTALTGGDVKLTGNVGAPHIEGRFTTDTVEISLANQLPPNVVSLDVVEIKNGEVQQKPKEEKAAPPIDAGLDIIIDMPRRIFVRGRGLDSEWSGRIVVKGTMAAPIVTGEMNVVRGQLDVVGKAFALKEGKVTLPQGAETDPTLDVSAVHKGKDLTVTARLIGPLSKPELELTSVPQVPRDEIISRVLFNKSASQLSAAEAAQLAIALRQLTGGGGGTDILGFARRTLGVDVLRVDTTESGNAAVEAGKYLTDEVYLGVKQGAEADSSSAGVEVEITPNITIESEVTGKGASKSGVRFQWDY